ncbi:MAG: ORF6N domain-containing protein [Flavobacteriales bacterium]|nr:ORF6N domain-containing protein [Flavobacteriales bacterium]
MAKKSPEILIPQEVLMSKIHEIRGQKVMLDSDLAELYQVETRRLNEQVRRNIDRFPEDFRFELTNGEWSDLKSQNATSSWGGRRKLPSVFTEHGILMLSSVLNSPTAIKVNIQIMRLFTRMREMIASHQEIFKQLDEIRNSVKGHDDQLQMIFEYLKQFEASKQQDLDQQNRKKIGYRSKRDE